ncbi:MAG: HAD family hydrolase [Bacilli bacterium]|nr:HAD family hydrolase [Bacilli bacterium]
MKKYDYVIFDLDGTLINTLEGITVAINHALKALNLPYQYEESEVQIFIGRGARRLFKLAMKREFSEEEYELYLKYYEEDQVVSKCYEGVEETLTKLEQAKVKLLIYSNKPDKLLQVLIKDKLKTIDFLVVQGQHNDYPPKPNVDLLVKILNENGLDNQKGLYIGDSVVDILTAKNANLDSCIVSFGYGNKKEIEDETPTFYINKFNELLDIVL